MKKPVWISVVGWLCVFWILCDIVGLVFLRPLDMKVDDLRVVSILFAPPLPLFGLWVLGTFAHNWTSYKARSQAQMMADYVRRYHAQAPPDAPGVDAAAAAFRTPPQAPTPLQTAKPKHRVMTSPLDLTGTDSTD